MVNGVAVVAHIPLKLRRVGAELTSWSHCRTLLFVNGRFDRFTGTGARVHPTSPKRSHRRSDSRQCRDRDRTASYSEASVALSNRAAHRSSRPFSPAKLSSFWLYSSSSVTRSSPVVAASPDSASSRSSPPVWTADRLTTRVASIESFYSEPCHGRKN